MGPGGEIGRRVPFRTVWEQSLGGPSPLLGTNTETLLTMDQLVYRKPEDIKPYSLHIEVIADYGGRHSPDPAFSEVRNHFLRFDTAGKLGWITETAVAGFSTIETGFWIAQIGLHSEHSNLVIFSNTAPRGKIAWTGEHTQPFVCGILDNGIPIFAVAAGYNLSFIKGRLKGLWEVLVPNTGTQFRSRDQYPEVTMAILNGDSSKIGKSIELSAIPDVPISRVASIDGYGNIKTTIRTSEVSQELRQSPRVKISIRGKTHEAINTLLGQPAKEGELKIGKGSSGGKNDPFIEIVHLMGSARKDFDLDAPRDDLEPIILQSG